MPDAETPAVIRDLAEGCVRAVREALQVELDFTPETLPVLDHWIDLADAKSGPVAELLVRMAGAYFGEVVRRAIVTARWHAPAAEPARWRVELDDVFLCLNPAGAAREALDREDAPGWNAHLRMDENDRRLVEEHLAVLGDIEPDDYYRMTVRFEVLDHAYEALRVRSRARAGTSPRFSAEVYAAAYDRPETALSS